VGPRTLLQLDRYYVFPSPNGGPNSHVKEYEIQGDYSSSDHLPVALTIELQAGKITGSRYKVNSFYLQDKSVADKLQAIWRS
jgi:hypothetical protein